MALNLFCITGTDPDINQGVAGSHRVQVGSFINYEHQLPQQCNIKVRVVSIGLFCEAYPSCTICILGDLGSYPQKTCPSDLKAI